MVDFEANGGLFSDMEVAVVAASVDDAEQTAKLADGLRLSYVKLASGLDAAAVSGATGAFMQTGDRTFLHATGFLLDPSGTVVQSVYASGPIGRLYGYDVLKRVRFERARRVKE